VCACVCARACLWVCVACVCVRARLFMCARACVLGDSIPGTDISNHANHALKYDYMIKIIHTNVRIYIKSHTCIYRNVQKNIHTYTYIPLERTCTHAHTYTYMYRKMHAPIIHKRIRIYMYRNIYTHIERTEIYTRP